jgi:hypothetical protein
MESFDAIVRELLARIRIHQLPRRVPEVEEVLPHRSSTRDLYSAPETSWGTAPRRREGDDSARPSHPRHRGSRRREGSHLPRASAVPTPRGLLACHPWGDGG